MGSHSYAGPRHGRPAGPRHAKPAPPGTVQRTAAAGSIAAAIVAGETFAMAGTAGAVTADTWAKLRMCESSGNYATNTGNGFYGAYQFNLLTWQAGGNTGLPSNASPAVQDAAAQKLYDSRGWQPWPACSAKLGLVDDRQASRGTPRLPLAPVTPVAVTPPSAKPVVATGPVVAKPVLPVSAPVGAPATAPKPAASPAGALVWSGHYLSVRDVRQVRADVKAWQAKMVAAGYPIGVDGRYGPQSAAATTQFEAAHALSVEKPGVVGPQVWNALFGH
jgi:hypothetical protein